MSQVLDVNGKNYLYTFNYKDNEVLRRSLNNLARRIHGIDFEQWYQDGYWRERYVPYSLLDGSSVVANISVNIIDFLILGQQKRYIQIGTVMTDEAYRGQGLSRILMEKILDEWEDNCDMIYLFANDSVLNFYPKFGFASVNEYECSRYVMKKNQSAIVRKLDMGSEEDRNLFYHTASNTLSFSKVTMQNNVSLVMFYCTSFMKDSIYYIDHYNTAIIAEFDGDTVYLQDVFSKKDILIDSIIDAIVNEETNRVVLGFTPSDISTYENKLLDEEDTTLFIKAGKESPFELNQLRFPILSHA